MSRKYKHEIPTLLRSPATGQGIGDFYLGTTRISEPMVDGATLRAIAERLEALVEEMGQACDYLDSLRHQMPTHWPGGQ